MLRVIGKKHVDCHRTSFDGRFYMDGSTPVFGCLPTLNYLRKYFIPRDVAVDTKDES